MPTREEILAGLEEEIWSPLTVNAVIESKAEKRAQKGRDLNMYTLDLSPRHELELFNDENISAFVDSLHQKTLLSDKQIRTQLAIRTSADHWTAVDMEISKEGVKIIHIDSSEDTSAMSANKLFEKLASKFEDKTKSKYFFLRHDSLPSDNLKSQSIQYDSSSCSRFALDILFHLSNLDSFDLMEKREQDLIGTPNAFKTLKSYPNERYFKASNMPVELAAIYRNTQSQQSFNSLPADLHEHVINKKGETLKNSAARHTNQIEVKGELKDRNQAIHHKRDGYVRDVAVALSQQADFTTRSQRRDVLTAMQDGVFLSPKTITPTTATTGLIREARALEGRKVSGGFLAWCRQTVYRKLNEHTLSQADRALEAGAPIQAIKELEKMRGLTSAHKQQLESIREKFSAETETPDNSLNSTDPSHHNKL